VEPGIYHYRRELGDREMRLHLRVEPDRSGVLVVNASGIVHLNATATELVKHVLDGRSDERAISEVLRVYRGTAGEVRRDLHRILDLLRELETAEDACPVRSLSLPLVRPFGREATAPYRADLALTYRIDSSGALDPEARRRVDRELSTEEWREVLDRLWKVGVPHVCFTGGEPTQRDDLVELVRHAEDQGMVTGLLTDGRRLRDKEYLNELLLAGLDHIQITLCSHDAAEHDRITGQTGAWADVNAGLRNAVEGDIYVVAHVIVTAANASSVAHTVDHLAGLGVHGLALSSPLRELPESEQAELQTALERGENTAHEHGMTVVWDLAAPYSLVNPVEIDANLVPEQIVRQHLYIEPDGDALPAQGQNIVLGNLLRDDWGSIWNNPKRHNL